MSKYLYLDRNTFFHRLDPRTKLLLTLAHFIASAALVEQLWLGGFVVFETLLLTTLSRSWKNIRKIQTSTGTTHPFLLFMMVSVSALNTIMMTYSDIIAMNVR